MNRFAKLLLPLLLAALLFGCSAPDQTPTTEPTAGYAQGELGQERFVTVYLAGMGENDASQAQVTLLRLDVEGADPIILAKQHDSHAFGAVVTEPGVYHVSVQCPGFSDCSSSVCVGDSLVYTVMLHMTAE